MNRRDSLKPVIQSKPVLFPPSRSLHLPEIDLSREETGSGEGKRLAGGQALEDKIRQLETQLREHPGEFSWYAHNELRQLYLGINERKSMEHADAILAQSVMDAHVLSALSDWQMEPSARLYGAGLAVVALLDKAERYPELLHLGAACLIKAGDLQAAQNRLPEAQRFYRWVLSLAQDPAPHSLEPYLVLARSRLDTFRL